MEVLAVTLFISILLALVFIVSFVSESRRQKGWRCAERDALLPLDDPVPRKPEPGPNKQDADPTSRDSSKS